MKVRIFLPSVVLLVLSHIAQAEVRMPAGYGIGRANEGAEQSPQVNYATTGAPKTTSSQLQSTQSQPMRVNNTYVVTTVTDGAPGSLRAAINSANSNPGFDQISFAIGSGPVTRRIGSERGGRLPGGLVIRGLCPGGPRATCRP